MLNRRALRIKAMQALYALTQAEDACENMVREDLMEQFMPDMNSMEPQDREELGRKRQDASKLFKSQLAKTTHTVVDEDVITAGEDALVELDRRKDKERKTVLSEALRSLDGIYSQFLLSLIAIDSVYRLALDAHADEKPHKSVRNLDLSNLVENPVLKAIHESANLEREVAQANVRLGELNDEVRKIWRNEITTDETFIKYLSASPDFEAHREWTSHLYRRILVKHENWQQYFAGRDLYWHSNSSVVRSLVSKVLKGIGIDDEEITLPELSPNWEDDREFFVSLYEHASRLSDEQMEMIASRVQNWDVERLSVLDKLILQLALAEMIYFPSIPVKVTINEYLEICKVYGTPKSRQFVNGILDVMATDLMREGVIRKSGRGLIDNK